jgi:outer membrane lipopolysaccharide assembly protein LptE/RlpB|tara:strand:+ start:28 stop:492 length:465 start_codon:yes stop_codon:yes gene_type:complete
MLKKIFLLFVLVFLSSCGYEAIYSKKNSVNYDFSISKLNFIGDRDINLKLKEKLNNYTLSKKDKNFTLKIFSISTKTIAAKDTSGDATSFKNIVTLNLEISMNGTLKNSFMITESFNYNNNSNKFSLKKYEKEIKNNLAETIAKKIIFKLSNIQ